MEKYKNIFVNRSILLVEDDEVSQMLVAESLRNTGVHLTICASSQQAYEFIAENPGIDLVLLDILLPDENGYILARHLRKKFPDLPIIAQTAYAMSTDKEKCFDAGCNDYLAKPLKPKKLIEKIRQYIS